MVPHRVKEPTSTRAVQSQVWADSTADAAREFALRLLVLSHPIVGAEQVRRLVVKADGGAEEVWNTRAMCEVDDRGVWCIQVGAERGM